MKKVGLLAGLGCLLTVSGVYATWIYAQASAGSVSESIIPQMAGVGESSKKGTISVKTSGLTMVIDNGGEYKPELISDGEIKVNFTASNGADATVQENGIKMEYKIGITPDWKYDSDGDGDVDVDDKDIFVLSDAYTTALNSNGYITANGGVATKDFTISYTEIAQYITLNVAADFKLDTRAKYDAFKTALNRASSLFTVTVREVVA